MVAKLVVEEGDLKGLSLSLDEGESWTVGRDPDECQLVIEDPLVSRKHFVARRTEEGFVIENLSVTNPVLVNDEEIGDQTRLLQNGDTLKIGNEILCFYEDTFAHVMVEGKEDENGISLLDEEENESHSPSEEELSESEIPLSSPPQSEELPRQDSVFGEEMEDLGPLANIDFGVVETGRWLLKVIGGPHNGAEFYMEAGQQYVLGTDPKSCDIVFHDNSVSRQHARISVSSEESLSIEDLNSRNGVLINGSPIQGKMELPLNVIVTLGTTSFVVYDREGEMQTIISPLLPSIVKVLQQEPIPAESSPPPRTDAEAIPEPVHTPPPPQSLETPTKPPRQFTPYIILTAIIGLFVLAGIGTTTLFHEEPIVTQTQENADELIQEALRPFPAIRWTFNKTSGSLLLLGHVSTLSDKNQLLYNLGNLKFIKNIDDNDVIIDEGVWNEVNSLLANNPAWKGISIHSPEAGKFILSGELKTRKQAEQLSSYLSLNFPYLDLLKKQIVVEEDIVNQINTWLREAQLLDVKAQMTQGEITLNGVIPPDHSNQLNQVIEKIKQIPGVRVVTNLTRIQTAETGIVNLSNQYTVTGKSRIGNQFTVVINGRILSEGDDLDGMTITKITTNRIYLEKGEDKFRIDY